MPADAAALSSRAKAERSQFHPMSLIPALKSSISLPPSDKSWERICRTASGIRRITKQGLGPVSPHGSYAFVLAVMQHGQRQLSAARAWQRGDARSCTCIDESLRTRFVLSQFGRYFSWASLLSLFDLGRQRIGRNPSVRLFFLLTCVRCSDCSRVGVYNPGYILCATSSPSRLDYILMYVRVSACPGSRCGLGVLPGGVTRASSDM